MSATRAPQLVTDDMDLFTLLLRLRVRLDEDDPANLAWVLPEVLVRCQSGVDDPERVLEAVGLLACAAPEVGRSALMEALERGVDATVLPGLVELLASLGANLAECEADSLRRVGDPHPGERVHAMYLLCALGPTTEQGCRAVLEADLGRLWRLEQLRVGALARTPGRSLAVCIGGLAHAEEAVRARAEAALGEMGPDAATAVPALLAMPPWEGADERPSPALYSIGEAAVPALRERLTDPSPLVRARAAWVLEATGASPEA